MEFKKGLKYLRKQPEKYRRRIVILASFIAILPVVAIWVYGFKDYNISVVQKITDNKRSIQASISDIMKNQISNYKQNNNDNSKDQDIELFANTEQKSFPIKIKKQHYYLPVEGE